MPLDQHPFWGREILGTFTIVKLLGLICLIVAIFHLASTDVTPHLLRTWQAKWYLAFALFQCSSYFVQGGQLASGAMAYSHVFSIFSLFIAALSLVDSKPRLYRVLLVSMGAAGFASLYTIRQQQKYGDMTGFRPGGLLGDANEYALVVGLWMPLAFLWTLSRRPLWERCLCFGSLCAALLGSTFASSRGGFIGLLAAFLFLVAHSGHRMRNFAIVSALIVPLTILSPSSPLRRFTDPNYGDKLAEQARLITWKAGLRMISRHPVFGVGLHNFKPLVTQYENPGENVVSLAHNTYVELAAELGVGALAVFVGMFITAFSSLERIRRLTHSAKLIHLSNIALGLQAGIVSYLFSAFFVSAWWQKMLWLLIFSTVCLDRVASGALIRARRNAAAELKSNKGNGTELPVATVAAR